MESSETQVARLSSCAFGIAFGLTWGLGMLILGLANVWTDWGNALVEIIRTMYLGYNGTITGAFWGLLWGFIDGFIFGFIIAWFYNLCLKYCHCWSCCPFSKKK